MVIGTKISSFLLPACILFTLFGCQKISDTYSTTPAITFKSYSLTSTLDSTGQIDYKIKLTISFTDGDGDIGLDSGQNTGVFGPSSPYFNNLWVGYYEDYHGQFVHVWPTFPSIPIGSNPLDTLNYNGRIPNVTPVGKNKAITGDINYNLDLGPGTISARNAGLTGGTIKFNFILYDRALHRSNLVESPEIALQ